MTAQTPESRHATKAALIAGIAAGQTVIVAAAEAGIGWRPGTEPGEPTFTVPPSPPLPPRPPDPRTTTPLIRVRSFAETSDDGTSEGRKELEIEPPAAGKIAP